MKYFCRVSPSARVLEMDCTNYASHYEPSKLGNIEFDNEGNYVTWVEAPNEREAEIELGLVLYGK